MYINNDFANRSLDEWYIKINSIYLDTNFYRNSTSIFTHLVEVIGGLSLLASDKQKENLNPKDFVSKCLAWWMALCGNVGIKSVSEMIWIKFPTVCSYCFEKPHNHTKCKKNKKRSSSPDWDELKKLGDKNRSEMPITLDEWQSMFTNIYPVGNDTYQLTFSRITEELGELAESIRVFPLQPSYFLSEASDVFAWLMHLQNLIMEKSEDQHEKAVPLSVQFAESYPDTCYTCKKQVCSCPPILIDTLGRIAKENPLGIKDAYEGSSLFSASEAIKLFEIGNTEIVLAEQTIRINSKRIEEMSSMIEDIRLDQKASKVIAENTENKMDIILMNILDLADSQRISQETLDEFVSTIQLLPKSQREVMTDFLGGVTSSVWGAAFVKAIELIPIG